MAGLAGVTHVAMETTGIYSIPVYYALLEHGDFEKVLICNAAHVKNVPGRKTDYADAEWLAHLLECGLLAGSFIPPAEIKAARDVIRYRTKIVQQRVSEIARLGNTLQDAGIKIDSVASSIATKSGRAMIEALIDGERRGPVLARHMAAHGLEPGLKYFPSSGYVSPGYRWRPQQDSNLRSRLRRPLLSPLSYGGNDQRG